MNKWAEQSMKIAAGHGYLDRLQSIYPVSDGGKSSVKLSYEQRNTILELLRRKRKRELLEFLFRLKRFPYDEPFLGFLRQHPIAMKQNPKTISRIWNRLSEMGFSRVVEGIERPMSPSRRFGQSFRNWLTTTITSCDISDISLSKKPVAINASDSVLAKYAREHLGYKRKKGLDLVILGGNSALIGEAKFISATGGTQDKSFRESVEFVRKYSPYKARAIAVIDGVVWAPSGLKNRNSLYARELSRLKKDLVIISALLLPKFIKEEL